VTAAVRRGEVWLADLDKTRPVIVLTRDPLGRLLHSVIVVPVTSTIRGLSTSITSSYFPAIVSVGASDGLIPQP
jgi:mRNA-degrading endonuclease toxin of MazEF toxin-antitoxin module